MLSTLPRPSVGPFDSRPPIVQPRPQSQFAALSPQGLRPASPGSVDASVEDVNRVHSDAQRRFERCMSLIRQIERNAIVQTRKSEQAARRVLRRTTDSILSLHHELNQLQNQRSQFQRKVGDIRVSVEHARRRGIQTVTAPLTKAIESFETEFADASSNIGTIFGNLNGRIQAALLTRVDIDRLPEVVKALEAQLSDVDLQYQRANSRIESTKRDFADKAESNRHQIVTKFNDRLVLLSQRIDALESKSGQALQQSQGTITNAQNSQFELGSQLRTSLDAGMSGFKKRIQDMKSDIAKLRRKRQDEADGIRSRLIASTEDSRNMANQTIEARPRLSLRPEIRALKKELRDLKMRLKAKFEQHPT
jgi:hypothetical protein